MKLFCAINHGVRNAVLIYLLLLGIVLIVCYFNSREKEVIRTYSCILHNPDKSEIYKDEITLNLKVIDKIGSHDRATGIVIINSVSYPIIGMLPGKNANILINDYYEKDEYVSIKASKDFTLLWGQISSKSNGTRYSIIAPAKTMEEAEKVKKALF